MKNTNVSKLSTIRMSAKQLRNTKGMVGICTPIKQLEWVQDQWHTTSIITSCLRGTSELQGEDTRGIISDPDGGRGMQ